MATTRVEAAEILRPGTEPVLADLEPAELPAAPSSLRHIIGPGIVAAGVGLGSSEFVIFPFIASQVGLAFVWAGVLGVLLQYVLITEVERYTLATGETVLTGFSRLGRHWGLVMVVLALFAALWPGWASAAAALVTFLVGGDARWIAIGMLAAIGLMLTLSPVVYRMLEGVQSVKAAAILLLVAGSLLFAIPGDAWAELPRSAAAPALPVETFGWAMLAGAIAFAGGGASSNLCQSSWIRDKGFGMGAHAARIESPFFGEPIATSGTGWRFEPDAAAMTRWRAWWRMARLEQMSTFVPMSIVTILFMSLLAFALLDGRSGLPQDISFLAVEGEILSQRVGVWFGRFFWFIGAFALFMTAVGVVDVVARLSADVLRTSYLPGRNESVVYAVLVWVLVAIGMAIIASSASQPLILLIISACVSGFTMFVIFILILALNCRRLDPPLRPSWPRIGVMVLAIGVFGALSAATFLEQAGRMSG